MSTANRLKHRKKAQQSPQPQQPQPAISDQPTTFRPKAPKHTEQKQSEYESYYSLSECNPLGLTWTNSVFPHTAQLHSAYNASLAVTCSPVLSIQNPEVEVMGKSADRIPRCPVCRSYMNCYNRIQGKKFTCFVCNREDTLDKDYDPNLESNLELKSSIFQCLGPSNFYIKEPQQETFVFLIDINSEAASTRMIYYAVAAMKEVLARPEMDDLCIYFFTYDELIQEYDFSGSDIKCTINDQTIEGQLSIGIQSSVLKDVRDKLFELLDALEDISASNPRKGSNFSKSFEFVFNALKHTGAKFFILQCNESIVGEQMFKQQVIKTGLDQPNQTRVKGPSLYETCNKSFFQKYVQEMLQHECSIGYFTFSRNYKNLKIIHDMLKLCSSDLKVYTKDSAVELQKFYYDFHYLLGATYFKNVRVEVTINTGWHFTAVYGNFYRAKEYISFQMASIDPSRKLTLLVSPSAHTQFNNYIPPYMCIQFISNYQYKRQSFLCVSTVVQPVTGYIEKLYQGIDPISTSSAIAKGFLSSLRMEDINATRKKVTTLASQIYLSALEAHKKKAQLVPDSILTILMSILGMLKSIHSQPEIINNTPVMDRVLSERMFLQFCSLQIFNFFNPYLFNLSDLQNGMCEGEDFQYPLTVEIKFHNVKNGLYLMDVGLALYLFIAKQCDGDLLVDVLGKPKFNKNDQINEEVLMEQTSKRAVQVQNLIKFLRQQKSYGWIPLHIVRCGENSLNERNFYLFFFAQKYQQFRSYRMNLQEFTAMISKPNSF